MANQPNVRNVQRAIRVPRELDAKIQKKFRIDEMNVKDTYIFALQFATKNVTLDAEDYERIEKDVRNAKKAR